MVKDSNVRRAQVIFLIILTVSAGQVVWWLIDQSLYARAVHDRWQELYKADVIAAKSLLDRGARADSIEDLFPHLSVGPDEVKISPAALDLLEQERRSHVNQYAWEGVFFLAVIFLGMFVIVRTVRRDAQLRRWQTNFLAAVSHELKSPIASLQLGMETLEMRGGDAERRSQLLTRMLSDLERLATTVSRVIDTERLDQRHVQMARERLDLSELVAATVEEQEVRSGERGVDFMLDVQEHLYIEADPVGARTILRNLLDNAVKYLGDDGGRVFVTVRATPQGVRLEVADDGVGFPAAEAKNLFQKFYRVGDELRRTRPGSGLGLYLTRRFVELDGGRISAHSDGPGLGAVFTVNWPPVPT